MKLKHLLCENDYSVKFKRKTTIINMLKTSQIVAQLIYDHKIVGTLSTEVPSEKNEDGFVELIEIEISARFKGKGLSKLLIAEMLKFLKTKNVNGIISIKHSQYGGIFGRSSDAEFMWKGLMKDSRFIVNVEDSNYEISLN